jgi:predicted cupin superfamily sugar epimerase
MAVQADPRSADEMIALLGLEPNQTCGFTRLSYSSPMTLEAGSLPDPFAAQRPVGSALYFLVTPDAPVRLHRIANDQLYHYYLGEPLELLLLTDGRCQSVVIGPDVAAGQHLQLLIPGGTFHTARVASGSGWFLGASTEWPGVIPADVELGDPVGLARAFPAAAAEIAAFTAR